MKVHIIFLKYDIMYNDPNEGPCVVDEGIKLLKSFMNEEDAMEFFNKYDGAIKAASKEHTIIPVQPNNQILRDNLGFDLHCLSQNYEDHHLVVESYEVKQ